MKKSRFHLSLLAISLAVITVLSGCNQTKEIKTNNNAATSDYVLSFVAADKTNWDLEVTYGTHVYTIATNLKKDNTFVLEGTCVGEAEIVEGENSQAGFAGANQPNDTRKEEQAKDKTDYSMYDFDLTGTWSYEKGWGYTLNFEDTNNTVVTADYDKASSRQYFYYNLAPVIQGEQQSSFLIQFQANDIAFRSEMAADYVIAEERNATYIFKASGKTQTGNQIRMNIYCMENGNATVINQSGSSTTYQIGSWTEDKTNHILSLTIGDTTTVAEYCGISGKEAYRMSVTSSGGFGPATTILCYLPLVDGLKASDYVDSDFEGDTVKTLVCPENDYSIILTEKGILKVMSGGTVSEKSTYTYDVASDVYKLVVGKEEYQTTKEDGIYSVDITLVVSDPMAAMFGGESKTYPRSFTFQ